jgi:predicted nucleotidyltransferase
MLTKTQEKILKIFVSKLNLKFSINEISNLLKKPYALIYHSIQELIKKKLLSIDERKLLTVNLLSHSNYFVSAEHARLEERLEKHKSISLFIQDCINEIKEEFFIFLIFGSFVEKDNFGDIDIIIIVDKQEEVEKMERVAERIASNFSFKTDINVISKESVQEMLLKREQLNILNESLNKHLIAFGAENFYRMVKNARR